MAASARSGVSGVMLMLAQAGVSASFVSSTSPVREAKMPSFMLRLKASALPGLKKITAKQVLKLEVTTVTLFIGLGVYRSRAAARKGITTPTCPRCPSDDPEPKSFQQRYK